MLATLIDPEAAAKALEKAREEARLDPWSEEAVAAADKALALRREGEDANLKPSAPSRGSKPGEDWIPPEPPPEFEDPW